MPFNVVLDNIKSTIFMIVTIFSLVDLVAEMLVRHY